MARLTSESSIYNFVAHPGKLASADTPRQASPEHRTGTATADKVAGLSQSVRNQANFMSITIYHNPRCSKSRKTLEILKSRNISPNIVEYLSTPPDADTLLRLARLLGLRLSDLLRRGEAAFKDAADRVPVADDQALAAWLHENPVVLERPIVVDEDKDRAVVGRPPENVLKLLHDD